MESTISLSQGATFRIIIVPPVRLVIQMDRKAFKSEASCYVFQHAITEYVEKNAR